MTGLTCPFYERCNRVDKHKKEISLGFNEEGEIGHRYICQNQFPSEYECSYLKILNDQDYIKSSIDNLLPKPQ